MAERAQRRLVAIVAADVAGYSRLIGADEEGTLRALRAHRTELIEPLLAEHGGRIANTAGDSLLLESPSAVDAVRFALAVQQAMAERNADIEPGRQIRFRVGINVGDVIAEGDDLLGDGVNIASRVEALADPGGIAISDDAHRQVRDRLQVTWQDGGEHEVKNIARPIQVWHWSAEVPEEAGGDSPDLATAHPLPDKPSIAVLPFRNMSGDPEQEYFSDGIAEDIISALSRFRWFFVISRNSSFAYKGNAVDLKRTAQDLGVQYVLEGSVRKAGSRVRVTAQLIDALADRHVWAEQYDRDLEDIFVVQDEITRSIVGAVAPEFLTSEMQRARRKDIPSLQAWELVTRAHWHLARFSKEDDVEAKELLERAIELAPDSSFGLSDLSLIHLRGLGSAETAERSMAEAGRWAEKAVLADDRDSYAHAMLAAVELYAMKHADAERRLRHAIALNPNDPHAHGILGRTLVFMGQGDEAVACVEEALRLSPRDPLVALWYEILCLAAIVRGRYEQSVDWAKKAVQGQPRRWLSYIGLAVSCGNIGDTNRAAQTIQALQEIDPGVTMATVRRSLPFMNPADLERFIEALRKAGLPE